LPEVLCALNGICISKNFNQSSKKVFILQKEKNPDWRQTADVPKLRYLKKSNRLNDLKNNIKLLYGCVTFYYTEILRKSIGSEQTQICE